MNKTILITGTSSGLGRATAKLFHARGWNVIATMRAPERESELTVLERALVTRLDVEDLASTRSAVAAGLDRFGRIDALVNNAGYDSYGPLETTPFSKIRRQFDVNVLGLLATTQAILPHFRANKSGTIPPRSRSCSASTSPTRSTAPSGRGPARRRTPCATGEPRTPHPAPEERAGHGETGADVVTASWNVPIGSPAQAGPYLGPYFSVAP